jgi:branched-subunit amino acid transport protein
MSLYRPFEAGFFVFGFEPLEGTMPEKQSTDVVSAILDFALAVVVLALAIPSILIVLGHAELTGALSHVVSTLPSLALAAVSAVVLVVRHRRSNYPSAATVMLFWLLLWVTWWALARELISRITARRSRSGSETKS